MQRLLSSPSFDASERNRRFLRYIVDETGAGRGERIKAYAIALEVFDRPPEFDPLLDPIVRIEAMRLRRSLDRFYLLEGPSGGLRLNIPKGRYIPILEPAARAVSPNDTHVPRLLVTPLVCDEDSIEARKFSEAFVHDLIVDLSRFPSLAVFSAAEESHSVDYVLRSNASERPTHINVCLHLLRAADQRVLWADRFEVARREEGFWSEMNVSASVARTLAQAYGVIFSVQADTPSADLRDAPSSYSAVHLFLDYWRSLDELGMNASEAALEGAMSLEPNNAEVRACLSLLHTNRARFRLIPSLQSRAELHRAMELAAEALELAPCGSWGYYALGLSYWFQGDIAGALSSLDHAVALNPNDMMLLAELGHRYAMRMDWDRAVPMLNAAYTASPSLPQSNQVGLFLYHFHHRRFDLARAAALKIRDLPVPHGALAMAAVSGELGDQQTGREALDQLERIKPGYLGFVRDDLRERNLHPTLIEEVLAGIEKLRSR
ncbi:hypothetical protein L0V05_05415 [Tabrizicola sp. J26]|uniref:hypothetical protein n=1 Tax=Alitabrizicola rongguiensis TaxID=2909234 RepID=UPI001F170302|nr:hypothetical protein [Tabrizicola rongguiensis]MCF1708256.1 hypothetical protein [Tabrizicola rongguiensis]